MNSLVLRVNLAVLILVTGIIAVNGQKGVEDGSKYGHGEDSVYTGSKTAEAEYYMGAFTPLAIAYGMAIDDGFIS